MNSGDLKRYKYVKISKSNFFTITILSLHSIHSESKKGKATIKILKRDLGDIHTSKSHNIFNNDLHRLAFITSINISNASLS